MVAICDEYILLVLSPMGSKPGVFCILPGAGSEGSVPRWLVGGCLGGCR